MLVNRPKTTMSMDEDVLSASVLAFLDEFYSHPALPDAADATATPANERTPRDANRARKEALRELMALRSAVPALEHELQLRRSLLRSRRSDSEASGSRSEVATPGCKVWKETAASQLTQRLRAEAENWRLRALVRDSQAILFAMRNKLLCSETSQAVRQFGLRTGVTSLPPFGLKAMGVIQELSKRVDSIYTRAGASADIMLSIHDGWGPTDVSLCGKPALINCGELQKLVAKRLLPFSLREAGKAAWEQYTCVIRSQAMSLFSHRTMEGEGPAAGTVIEYFGMKLTHENTSAEFRVTQVMKRFTESAKDVIIWESVVDPIAINDRRLDGISFRETGRVLVRPSNLTSEHSPSYTIAEISYAVAPPTRSDGSVSANSAGITEFVRKCMANSITMSYYMIENLLFRGV